MHHVNTKIHMKHESINETQMKILVSNGWDWTNNSCSSPAMAKFHFNNWRLSTAGSSTGRHFRKKWSTFLKISIRFLNLSLEKRLMRMEQLSWYFRTFLCYTWTTVYREGKRWRARARGNQSYRMSNVFKLIFVDMSLQRSLRFQSVLHIYVCMSTMEFRSFSLPIAKSSTLYYTSRMKIEYTQFIIYQSNAFTQ